MGDAARALVLKWKQMVEEESENEEESVTEEFANTSYNGDKGNENHRDKFEKRSKGHSEKPSKSHDHKEQYRTDHSKNNKRKSEPEYEHYKDKKQKYENVGGLSIQDSIASSIRRGSFNGNNLSDDDYSDKPNNGVISEDENSMIPDIQIKTEREPYGDPPVPSLQDDLNDTEYAVGSLEEPWHRKEDIENHQHGKSSKREKSSSHRHKSKSSSSSSDKSKHSSSTREEHKESKNLNKNKEERFLYKSNMSSHKKDGCSSDTGKSDEKSKSKDKDKKDRQKDKHRSKDDKKSKDSKEKEKKTPDEDGVDSFSGKVEPFHEF